ncbi:MAG: carbamoyltransferase HypF, partial [Candidatus Bathyarchaeota archaeon]
MHHLKINVTGIVQGVGFRPFIYRIAMKNKLKGYVRNMGDAGVEIVITGKKGDIDNFLKDLRENKPSLAKIHRVTTSAMKETEKYDDFTISVSSRKTELSGSVIPPDVAICDQCLLELKAESNPRYDYFFITCTDCGPRFTTIERLPYDRKNTTMKAFPMCDFCREEYKDSSDRRFHAQTVACTNCGPEAYLTENNGSVIDVKSPIREAAAHLSEGSIVAIKGYGGFHLVCTTTKEKPLIRLRATKHRKQKPFAVMTHSLEVLKTFAEFGDREAELLTSYIRPIVVLRKSENYFLSELVAPKLHNIGVMLPYTGLHYMLFVGVSDPAFVMTSANPSNQPLIKEDNEALKQLGTTVDYFLFHNRQIAHRCDDSVVRVHRNKGTCLLRRSRGYAPAPIYLKTRSKRCALGLGGELNVVSCVLKDDKAFLSQHIGDVENIETLQFLEEATKHLVRLTNTQIEIIACDLHPKFNTTKLAYRMGEELDCPVMQVQHHHAHISALMAEHNLNEIIGIACDGYGYGEDGEAWGGEILYCSQEGYKRVGHLEEHPMPGGDLATRYPLRMASGILDGKVEIDNWLLSKAALFPYRKSEVELILRQLKKGVKLGTTSCGRILDAVSAILGICHERTYEGEPAMKLEAIASKGKEVLNLEPQFTEQ